MKIIAHRGYSDLYPENTLIAFSQAISVGAGGIELDIHQLEDEFIVFHDWDMQRLTGCKLKISDTSLEQVAQLKVNDHESIPKLSEVGALVRSQLPINIEIKSLKNVELFSQYLQNMISDFDCNLILSSFDHSLLNSCRLALRKSAGNTIKYAGLVEQCPPLLAAYTEELELEIAAINCHHVSQAFVDDAHARGKEVWCYTVNTLNDLSAMYRMGVDAIFTDKPEWAKESIEQLYRA